MPSIFFLECFSLFAFFFALKLKPVYEGRNVLKIFFFFSLAESFFYFTFNVSSCLRNTFDLSRSAQLASLAFRFDSSARWKGKKKKEKRLKEILKLTLKLFLLALFPSRIRLACLIENFPQKTRSKNWKRGKKESILWFHVILLFFPTVISPSQFLWEDEADRREAKKNLEKNQQNQSRKTLAFPKA